MEATQHSSTAVTSPGVVIDDGALSQLAYHVRWSAALVASGQVISAAHHAIIAGAMLEVLGGDALRATTRALDLPEVHVAASPSALSAQRSAAIELSYQFVSHFTSDGRHDLADLYTETARRICGDV
jgi:hypothetical protein